MQFTPIKQLDRFRGVLSAQLLSSQTTGTFQINNTTALGSQLVTMAAGYYARVTIEDEHILLSAFSVSGSTVTCTIASGGRGYNGTTAATHASDTTVECRWGKSDVDNMNNHLARFDDDGMIIPWGVGGVVPTITDANTLSFASVDYTAYLPVGMVILYKVVSTWYRATVTSSSFSTNTTVEITGDGLVGSGTILSFGVEMSRSVRANKVYDLLKQCTAAPAENPPSGYAWFYLESGSFKMKDSTGTVSTFLTDLSTLVTPTGAMVQWLGGVTPPSGWLACDGSAVSRTTYANLFAILIRSLGTFTVTIAAPGVATLAAHGMATGDSVYLTTTGALPTGLAANTRYWITKIDANTFKFATSLANALVSTNITTSGSQSGTHTLRLCPFGLGDGSTTFNLPAMAGVTVVGKDQSQAEFAGLGQTGGAKTHTLTTPEIPAHTHSIPGASGTSGGFPPATAQDASGFTSGSTGGGGAHNNLQPYITLHYIVKT